MLIYTFCDFLSAQTNIPDYSNHKRADFN